MQEFFQVSEEQIRVMASHYVTCALWTSTDEGGNYLDGREVSPEAHAQAIEHCTEFCAKAGFLIRDLLAVDDYGTHPDCGPLHPKFAAMGHDLWFTRNGHGAGFWDRGLDKLGDKLTEIAEAMGTKDAYVGDNGLVYFG